MGLAEVVEMFKEVSDNENFFLVDQDNDILSGWEHLEDAAEEHKEYRKNGYKVRVLSRRACVNLGII